MAMATKTIIIPIMKLGLDSSSGGGGSILVFTGRSGRSGGREIGLVVPPIIPCSQRTAHSSGEVTKYEYSVASLLLASISQCHLSWTLLQNPPYASVNWQQPGEHHS